MLSGNGGLVSATSSAILRLQQFISSQSIVKISHAAHEKTFLALLVVQSNECR